MTVSPVGERPIRLATIPVVLCVGLYSLYRAGEYFSSPEINYYPGLNSTQVALALTVLVALSAVQLQFALRRPSRLGARVLLSLQVLLTFTPYLVLGDKWGAPVAFVVASVLLTLTGWRSWLLAGLAVAANLVIRTAFAPGVLDNLDRGTVMNMAYAAMVAVANGLLLFGMTRLSELVRDLYRTRAARAPLEVARERLRIARGLQGAVGGRLVSIITMCQRAEVKNAQLVAGEARQAVAQVRTVTDDYRDRSLADEIEAARTVLAAADVEVVADEVPETLPAPVDALLAAVLRRTVIAALQGVPPEACRIELDGSARMRVAFTGGVPGAMDPDDLAGEVAQLGGELYAGREAGVEVRVPVQPDRLRAMRTPRPVAAAPWLAWGIMALIELDLFVTMVARGSGAWHWVGPVPLHRLLVMMVLAVPLSLLQLHHVRPRSGRVPPRWQWTLSLQIVLGVALSLIGGPVFPANVYGGVLAGVILFHLRRPWSWVLAGVVIVSSAWVESYNFGLEFGASAILGSTWQIYAMIAVAALCRLPVAAEQLIDARQELARLAVVRERLRIARDTHDLLGFQLSAIAVKAGLAARLSTKEPDAARTHLMEAGQIGEQALLSLRSITGEPAGLSFAEEIESARSMLSAAEIAVTVELHAAPEPELESTLAIVLREAVTNVVRHSHARMCRIETSALPGGIRLSVINDGVSESPGAATGNGLANLKARAVEAGGHLTAQRQGDRFSLVAEIRAVERRARPATASLQPGAKVGAAGR